MTTDPQEEMLIQVDEKNQIIGSISRKDAHERQGVFYRTIFVLVRNGDREVLVQKRSPTKDLFPNHWDLSVGGHVNYGQSYTEAAARELKEELGIDASEDELVPKGDVLVTLPHSGEHFKVFEYNIKPNQNVSVSEEEINETRWMTIEDIKKSMSDKSLQWYARPEQVIRALY